MIRTKSLVVFTAISLTLFGAGLLLAYWYTAETGNGFRSVELGLLETSPRGQAGGLAIPASGDSSTNPPTATIEVRNITTSSDWTGADTTIFAGEETELRWSSTNASTCSGSNFETGGATGGSTGSDASGVNEPAVDNTTLYTVSCENSVGTANDFLNITTLGTGPDISSDSIIVNSGSDAEVSWYVGNATNCVINGPGLDNYLVSTTTFNGSEIVTIENESTYSISCDNDRSDEVTIQVLPRIQET